MFFFFGFLREEWVKESLKAQVGLTALNVKEMSSVLDCTLPQNLKTLAFADFWCSHEEYPQLSKAILYF